MSLARSSGIPKYKHEAFGETEAGRFARIVSDILYDYSGKLGEDNVRKLRDVEHYLEVLAWAEVKKLVEDSVPDWVRKLLTGEDKWNS